MGKKVLIIEDDKNIRTVLKHFLESEGYRVVAAFDGDSGLKTLRSADDIGIILLDLRMPGMDGREFRVRQLEDQRIADIPVVIMSADRNAPQMQDLYKVAGVITKPFDPDQLLRGISRFAT